MGGARGGFLVSLLLAATAARAEAPAALEPLVVTAARVPQPAAQLPVAVARFEQERWRAAPALGLDGVLREAAAFSLFRRSGSLAANPTAQGFSLRGLGPSGASRSLALLDGVPLNDPFGGWVAWNAVPRAALARAELVRGGGSGAWGNAALGGVLQLFTRAETGDSAAGRAEVLAGERGLAAADFSAATAAGAGWLRLSGSALTTDGFYALAPADRGAVDRALRSRHQAWLGQWSGSVGDAVRAQVTARWADEQRGNGTVLQANASRVAQVGATFVGAAGPDRAWRASVYGQRQRFSSFFSAVSADRATETPANDQFDVPASAAGGAVLYTWQGEAGSTTAGADLRWVEGETREDFLYSGGRFTRRRTAGGEQDFGGLFAHHERSLGAGWRGTAALRADCWQSRAGFRRETDLASGAVGRDERGAAGRGTEWSPQVGLTWAPGPAGLRVRGAAYRAFRVPTLNELHRPFRVGIINTEANPALRRERLAGAELGAEWTGVAGRAEVTVFTNDLRDAVANVTLVRTPTLISRQRRNLDRVRVRGLEAGAEARLSPAWRLRVDWLFSEATVAEATLQPSLAGRRLPQVPRHTLTAGADWTGPRGWSAGLRARYAARQFEDDENLLPLAAAWTADLVVRRQVGAWEVALAAENLTDAAVETGRSNEGLVSLGSPRLVRASLGRSW